MSFGEEFLTMPDLFPARKSGEAWGELALAVDLPGGPYRIEGLNPAQAAVVGQRFADATGPSSREESATLHVFRAAGGDFLPIETAGWEYTLDTDHTPRGVRIAGLDLMARVDEAPQPGAALWTHLEGGSSFLQAFENVLRLYLAYRVFAGGGLVLHSSAALAADEAYVFVGRSGAGKSTAARLSLEAGRDVLSDDLNALLPHGGTFLVRALPFTGDLEPNQARNGAFPVARLCRLEQAPNHETRPLSRAQVASLLVACAPFMNADPLHADGLLERAGEIAERVPACVLRFRPDGGFWQILSNLEV
jgi:hypothetical protein